MFQTKGTDRIKINILCSMTFFCDNHAINEILWKNMVQPERPHVHAWQIKLQTGTQSM